LEKEKVNISKDFLNNGSDETGEEWWNLLKN
jgi:hypothetical protein